MTREGWWVQLDLVVHAQKSSMIWDQTFQWKMIDGWRFGILVYDMLWLLWPISDSSNGKWYGCWWNSETASCSVYWYWHGVCGHCYDPDALWYYSLERAASVLQGVSHNYATNELAPIVNAAHDLLHPKEEFNRMLIISSHDIIIYSVWVDHHPICYCFTCACRSCSCCIIFSIRWCCSVEHRQRVQMLFMIIVLMYVDMFCAE